MKKIIVQIEDDSKADFFLELCANLEFVNVIQIDDKPIDWKKLKEKYK